MRFANINPEIIRMAFRKSREHVKRPAPNTVVMRCTESITWPGYYYVGLQCGHQQIVEVPHLEHWAFRCRQCEQKGVRNDSN